MSEASIPDRLGYAPPARREHVPLAIVYMIGATIVFAASSAASKWLVATYPVGEVLFTRTAVALIVCRCSSCRRPGSRCSAPGAWRQHVMRSMSQAFSQTLPADRVQPDAAGGRHRHQLLRAAVRHAGLGAAAQGGGRPDALERAAGRLPRRARSSPARAPRRSRSARCSRSATPCSIGSVTAAVRGMTATKSAETLTLYQLAAADRLLRAVPAVRMGHAHAGRRRLILFNGVANAHRPVLVDAVHPPRARLRGHAVLLFLAGVGEHPGICGLGRGADREPGDRLRRSWSAPACSCCGARPPRGSQCGRRVGARMSAAPGCAASLTRARIAAD